MKEFYIGQLRTDDEIQDFFMVKAIAIKIGSNKKQYLDLLVCDNTGELTAKKWDVADAELPTLNEIGEGDIIKLKGNVTEWNGMRQLRVQKLRKAVPEDNAELMDYIKAAPEKAEYMYEFIVNAAEGNLFERESTITYGDLDFERIKFERTYGQSFEESTSAYCSRIDITRVPLSPVRMVDANKDKLLRKYQKNPFVPSDPTTVDQRCREIFSIQAAGLAKRIEHTHSRKAVVGISGGLDSTLALLVCAETFKLIGKDPKDIVAVTMPGFGTTGKTYNNAQTIMKLLGANVREIPIRDAVIQHFKDISHDPAQHDVTYENSQARERTQILMDIANKEGGLVVGTGDLSEVALGWSTYNGDHMSMYGVNASVPKTLVRFVIKWVMDHRLSGPTEEKNFSQDNELLRKTLQDIMDTPISPELLPPDESGEIAQKTEDTVGPYILHDFFMFYTIRFGMSPKKLLFIAKSTFADEYSEEFIKKWLVVFYRRFFSQQFKRSCIPDGPKVGSVSLSPRGDWRMPSDADSSVWLKELE